MHTTAFVGNKHVDGDTLSDVGGGESVVGGSDVVGGGDDVVGGDMVEAALQIATEPTFRELGEFFLIMALKSCILLTDRDL